MQKVIPHSSPCIGPSDLEAVNRIMASGMVANGQESCTFEAELADYANALTAITTTGGTSALVLCLLALGIGKNDEVVIPTYVCPEVAKAIIMTGATPVPCDSGSLWTVTVDTVRPTLSAKTKAIVAVNIFGIRADLEGLAKLGPAIIEDACQSFGHLPTKSPVAARFVSFHGTKEITCGEGGAAFTTSPTVQSAMRKLCETPQSAKGTLSRLSDIQAALGRSQMAQYPQFLSRRRELAERYFTKLAGLDITLPTDVRETSVFFRFPIKIKNDVQRTMNQLAQSDIIVRRGVDTLVHQELGLPDQAFPMAKKLFSSTISLPLYPSLTNTCQDRIIEACKSLRGQSGH